MRLAPLYQQQIAEATQQGIQQGVQQGIQQGIQQGLQQGIQQGIQQGVQQGIRQGVQQGERLVIETFLKVRFGAIDDRLHRVIDALLTLTPEEFTPLLLNLSQEELIDRFGSSS